MDDSALVRAAKEAQPGDGRAFSELVRRHEGHVRANCRYIVADELQAEDLAQEIFLKAYFGIEFFRGTAKFLTWVQRIKVNHCLNYLESKGRRVFVDVEAPGISSDESLHHEPPVQRDLERADDRRRIDGVLNQMNQTLRVPLVLRDMDGLSYEEVAEVMEIGLSAAKMRIKRARDSFRELWAATEAGGRS